MTQLAEPSTRIAGEPWHVTRESYRQMIASGVFDREHVELIRGRIVQMSPMGLPHDRALMKASRALRRIFAEDRFTVRSQQQFHAADDSAPEPDLCVVNSPVEEIAGFPRSALLIVEISESSLPFDRNVKAPLYAESGVADYWIINLIDNVVEVYRNPHAISGPSHAYDPAILRKPGESIDVLAMPGATIAVADLLP